ncbi:hypothetical protein B0H11DRAFT_2183591 [Mycena galericulata]|nr:hypothetical protein B0H11DRAFT_2183591 [Mycena galericulata]
MPRHPGLGSLDNKSAEKYLSATYASSPSDSARFHSLTYPCRTDPLSPPSRTPRVFHSRVHSAIILLKAFESEFFRVTVILRFYSTSPITPSLKFNPDATVHPDAVKTRTALPDSAPFPAPHGRHPQKLIFPSSSARLDTSDKLWVFALTCTNGIGSGSLFLIRSALEHVRSFAIKLSSKQAPNVGGIYAALCSTTSAVASMHARSGLVVDDHAGFIVIRFLLRRGSIKFTDSRAKVVQVLCPMRIVKYFYYEGSFLACTQTRVHGNPSLTAIAVSNVYRAALREGTTFETETDPEQKMAISADGAAWREAEGEKTTEMRKEKGRWDGEDDDDVMVQATPFDVRDIHMEISRETFAAAMVGRVWNRKSSLLQGLVDVYTWRSRERRSRRRWSGAYGTGSRACCRGSWTSSTWSNGAPRSAGVFHIFPSRPGFRMRC